MKNQPYQSWITLVVRLDACQLVLSLYYKLNVKTRRRFRWLIKNTNYKLTKNLNIIQVVKRTINVTARLIRRFCFKCMYTRALIQ